MESAHPDVRVRAAAARAALGDARALAPLLAQVTEKEPTDATARAAWVDRVARALAGLGDLGAGSGEVLAAVAALVRHDQKAVRDAAARALGWVTRPGGDVSALVAALAKPDKDVKLEAAIGLAFVGDPAGLPVLKGLVAGDAAAALRGVAAAVALGRPADDLLAAFLDHGDERVRGRALLLMMLVESSAGEEGPTRSLAALASAHPRVRLAAARALEAFSDAERFRAFVVELTNDRGEDKAAWAVPAATVRALAEVSAWGDPQLRARAVRLLESLDEEKQDRFDREWGTFDKRFAKDVAKLVAAGEKRRSQGADAAQLGQVVLGAYAGLSRMAGAALEMRVRQTAIARLDRARAGGRGRPGDGAAHALPRARRRGPAGPQAGFRQPRGARRGRGRAGGRGDRRRAARRGRPRARAPRGGHGGREGQAQGAGAGPARQHRRARGGGGQAARRRGGLGGGPRGGARGALAGGAGPGGGRARAALRGERGGEEGAPRRRSPRGTGRCASGPPSSWRARRTAPRSTRSWRCSARPRPARRSRPSTPWSGSATHAPLPRSSIGSTTTLPATRRSMRSSRPWARSVLRRRPTGSSPTSPTRSAARPRSPRSWS